MTAAIHFGRSDRLVCTNNADHRLIVFRSGDHLVAGCVSVECSATKAETIASLAWYDDHANLSVLIDWLGDLSPSGFRHVIEKPWKWEDEFRTAVAARDHGIATGHEVLHDGSDDTGAYCDHEGCDWRVTDGVVQELVVAP